MLTLSILFIFVVGRCQSCTEIILRAKDDSITLGRSMDFDITVDVEFHVEAAGTKHVSVIDNDAPEECKSKRIHWTSIYRGIALQFEEYPGSLDGVNEKGLTVSMLYLPGYTKYEDICKEECVQALSQVDVQGYILGNYATVNDVRQSLEQKKFPCVTGNIIWGMVQPLHYSVTDESGDSIIIEYTPEGRKVYNNTIRVMTNSPTYDWHMINVKNHFHFGNHGKPERKYTDGKGNEHTLPNPPALGLLGLPGDYSSPSRFLRAAAMVQYSKVPDTSEEAILTVFHIIDSVKVVKGTVEGRRFEAFTFWHIAKDLTHKCIYYKTYEYVAVRKVCLDDVEDNSFLPIVNHNERFMESVLDVSNKFKTTKDEL